MVGKNAISLGTAANIKNNCKLLSLRTAKNNLLSIKRVNWGKDNGKVIDERLHSWYLQMQGWNLPAIGPMLVAKVREIANSIGNTTLQGSNGWLFAFQCCHNIFFKVLSGKSN